jgi:hypothetical protein
MSHTYCGFSLSYILSHPHLHQSALEAARVHVRSCEALSAAGQCSQEALDSARDRLDALAVCLREVVL